MPTDPRNLPTRLRSASFVCGMGSVGDEAADELERTLTLRPRDEWHEDYGDVLWHTLDEWGGLCEAPVIARDMDEDLEDKEPWPGYYTHWSHLPRMPRFPLRSAKIAPDTILICDGWDFVDA